MTKNTGENLPQPQKGHINQNLVIAIIGAAATLVAAVLPWVLDKLAEAEASQASGQVTFTAAPNEFTATSTVAAASPTPTLEPPTQTATSTEETGIYNTFLTFDFAGKFIKTSFRKDQSIYLFFDLNDPQGRNIVEVIVSVVEVPGILADAVTYQILDEFTDPQVELLISSGKLSPGKYKVDLYLNNTLEQTMEFEVTE